MAQQRRNLCCVGDDDQSIYSWRGAEIGNILRFEKDFPGATIARLEQNYRSTSHILGAAGGMIAQNRGRLGKTLWTEADEGEKVVVRAVWDAEEEARWVGDEIEALQRKRHALSEIAILVRAGFQTREFEERFISLGVALSRDRRAAVLRARRRSATRSPICGWSISRPTISPSSAS